MLSMTILCRCKPQAKVRGQVVQVRMQRVRNHQSLSIKQAGKWERDRVAIDERETLKVLVCAFASNGFGLASP
jgi:hypothetical protein